MNHLNSILIEGNICGEVEMKYIPSGTAVAKFTIASNESYKKGDTWEKNTCFVEVEAWGKQAESCKSYLVKGQQVRVTGKLKMDSWEKDGKKQTRLRIKAGEIEFGKKPEGKTDQPADSKEFHDDVPF